MPGWGSITDKGIAGLCNLRSLNLDSNHIITNEGIAVLKNLSTLKIGFSTEITDLRLLTNLTHLDMTGNVTVKGAGISGLVNLTFLRVTTNLISDEEVSSLTNLTNFERRRGLW